MWRLPRPFETQELKYKKVCKAHEHTQPAASCRACCPPATPSARPASPRCCYAPVLKPCEPTAAVARNNLCTSLGRAGGQAAAGEWCWKAARVPTCRKECVVKGGRAAELSVVYDNGGAVVTKGIL
jgi:hypothetical protein